MFITTLPTTVKTGKPKCPTKGNNYVNCKYIISNKQKTKCVYCEKLTLDVFRCVCVFYLPLLLYFLCLRVCVCVYILFTPPLFCLLIPYTTLGEKVIQIRDKRKRKKNKKQTPHLKVLIKKYTIII